MTTLLKELRLTLTAKHPENRTRHDHGRTSPWLPETWEPEAEPDKPKANPVSVFELLSLYK